MTMEKKEQQSKLDLILPHQHHNLCHGQAEQPPLCSVCIQPVGCEYWVQQTGAHSMAYGFTGYFFTGL